MDSARRGSNWAIFSAKRAYNPLVRYLSPLLLGLFLLTGDVMVRPASAGPAFKLRIATLAPERSPLGREYQKLNRGLKERTDGQVRVQLYSGGTAGDEKTVVRKMRVGQLDGALLTAVGLGALVRQVLVLQAPGLITSYGELDRVRETLEPELEALFDKAGYKLIAWGDTGRIRIFSKKRVLRPSDLQNVRPWVWRDSVTMKEFVRATGANGVALSVPEVYPGLQTDMIDTVISSSVAVIAFQWHSRLKTMSKQGNGVIVGAFVIRKDRLEALPQAGQDYILETARATESGFRRIGRKLDNDASVALAKRLEVVDLDDYQRAWDAAARRARESLAGRLYSKALLDRVQKIVETP